MHCSPPTLRVAEFFAGLGLVRMGLEAAGGFEVVFANDIDAHKRALYLQHFGEDAGEHYVCGDVAALGDAGVPLPVVDLATASFPCTDLSLAGQREGLAGRASSAFWGFAQVLARWSERGALPAVVLLENVEGLVTSRGGADLAQVIRTLGELGYGCDVLRIDAAHFVPQSRRRVFIVASQGEGLPRCALARPDLRPPLIERFYDAHPGLALRRAALPALPRKRADLGFRLEALEATEPVVYWDEARRDALLASLSEVNRRRLDQMLAAPERRWATAYRRTRGGRPMWELRDDGLAGCLRTARGGSSQQAVVETRDGSVFARWMTGREYAMLQGAPSFTFGDESDSRRRFAFGDAVCVDVVAWLAQHYLVPVLRQTASG